MKPKKLICKHCGKEFTATEKAQKFCTVECRYIYSQLNRCKKAGYEYKKKKRWREQPCWNCKNACGGCSWSKSFTPVEGWIAEPTTIIYKSKNKSGEVHRTDTYKIYECPEFVKG